MIMNSKNLLEETYDVAVVGAGHAGCEDCYLFASESSVEKSLLDVLELNEEVNDIFSNYRMTGILKNIAYDEENILSVS